MTCCLFGSSLSQQIAYGNAMNWQERIEEWSAKAAGIFFGMIP